MLGGRSGQLAGIVALAIITPPSPTRIRLVVFLGVAAGVCPARPPAAAVWCGVGWLLCFSSRVVWGRTGGGGEVEGGGLTGDRDRLRRGTGRDGGGGGSGLLAGAGAGERRFCFLLPAVRGGGGAVQRPTRGSRGQGWVTPVPSPCHAGPRPPQALMMQPARIGRQRGTYTATAAVATGPEWVYGRRIGTVIGEQRGRCLGRGASPSPQPTLDTVHSGVDEASRTGPRPPTRLID